MCILLVLYVAGLPHVTIEICHLTFDYDDVELRTPEFTNTVPCTVVRLCRASLVCVIKYVYINRYSFQKRKHVLWL